MVIKRIVGKLSGCAGSNHSERVYEALQPAQPRPLEYSHNANTGIDLRKLRSRMRTLHDHATGLFPIARSLTTMHIIAWKPLRDFCALHPDADTPLRAWYREVEHAHWEKYADVRAAYPSADQVGKYTVFNIGGNKYRLIVVIHYNRGKVYVRHILPHKAYDRGKWKND
jgi:mRNA interferase HigB